MLYVALAALLLLCLVAALYAADALYDRLRVPRLERVEADEPPAAHGD